MLAVARALVVFRRRPGGQSQFNVHLRAQLTEQSQLGGISDFVLANLSADLSLARLAHRAATSERSLMRLFREELHRTPARYVEAARVEAARIFLETGTTSIQQVAHRCECGSTDTLRRAFVRHLGISPGDYRQRFLGAARAVETQSDQAGSADLRIRWAGHVQACSRAADLSRSAFRLVEVAASSSWSPTFGGPSLACETARLLRSMSDVGDQR